MSQELFYLMLTTITVSFFHTVTGPDHYLPFIALSKTQNWTVQRTIFWTLICGLGHVASSIVLGIGGIALGWSLSKIEWLENVRGGIAGWALLVLGLGYFLYSLWLLTKNRLHKHFEFATDNKMYVYEHQHGQMVYPQQKRKVTPWVLFIIFVLGPCEPLIPLLSFPAAKQSLFTVILLVSVFTAFTLLTMVTMVLLGYFGFSFFKHERLEKYMHVFAASTIIICGVGMLFLSW